MKDNPKKHMWMWTRVSFSREPGTTIKVWSYQKGKGREYHMAFVGPDGHTIALKAGVLCHRCDNAIHEPGVFFHDRCLADYVDGASFDLTARLAAAEGERDAMQRRAEAAEQDWQTAEGERDARPTWRTVHDLREERNALLGQCEATVEQARQAGLEAGAHVADFMAANEEVQVRSVLSSAHYAGKRLRECAGAIRAALTAAPVKASVGTGVQEGQSPNVRAGDAAADGPTPHLSTTGGPTALLSRPGEPEADITEGVARDTAELGRLREIVVGAHALRCQCGALVGTQYDVSLIDPRCREIQALAAPGGQGYP